MKFYTCFLSKKLFRKYCFDYQFNAGVFISIQTFAWLRGQSRQHHYSWLLPDHVSVEFFTYILSWKIMHNYILLVYQSFCSSVGQESGEPFLSLEGYYQELCFAVQSFYFCCTPASIIWIKVMSRLEEEGEKLQHEGTPIQLTIFHFVCVQFSHIA